MTDLTNRQFGRWTVIRRYRRRGKLRRWWCRCRCGVERPVLECNLGRCSRSCGCAQREATAKRNKTHGLRHHPLYSVWFQIVQRCTNSKHKRWPRYGGRGITVCRRWTGPSGFSNFLADMGPKPSATSSVDRRHNGRGYSPANCRWANKTTQSRNSAKARILTVNGQRRCIAEWAEVTGIPRHTIQWRISHGWSAVEAVTKPIDTRKRNKC